MHAPDQPPLTDEDHVRLRFQLASTDQIRAWSSGVVSTAKILALDEQRFHNEGLFSEQIFGPVAQWDSPTDGDRWKIGHIELPCPIFHPLFRRGSSFRIICDLLEIDAATFDEILGGETCVVTESLDPRWKSGDRFNYGDFRVSGDAEPHGLKVLFQGEAIRWLLRHVNIDQAIEQARKKSNSSIGGNRVNLLRHLQHSGNHLDWLVFDVIPVISPALRPFRFDADGSPKLHWLNRLYQAVLKHCRLFRRIIPLNPPEAILRSLSSKLQSKVERLFVDVDALRFADLRSRKWSLEPMLRRTLRERTDRFFSGRFQSSMRLPLVPNPSISLSQCGLPRVVETLELYASILWPHFERRGLDSSQFLRKLRHPDTEIWDLLEQELPRQAVLLTQHQGGNRTSLLAFQPMLSPGAAIQVSPLIAKTLKVDSANDDVTAYLPRTRRACAEAINLMQIDQYRDPANGRFTFEPTAEMLLGCLQLTLLHRANESIPEFNPPLNRMFRSFENAISAFEHGAISLQTQIIICCDPSRPFSADDIKGGKIITSTGRILFNEVLPRSLPFVNNTVGRNELSQLIASIHAQFGLVEFRSVVQKLQFLLTKIVTHTGNSLAQSDLTSPPQKPAILERAYQQVAKLRKFRDRGVLTSTEMEIQRADAWTHACDQIRSQLPNQISDQSLMGFMTRSGLINRSDLMRCCAMIGYFAADENGRLREQPILSSWCEGLTLSDYWLAARDRFRTTVKELKQRREIDEIARKLLRRMAYISVTEIDCGTSDGVVKDWSAPEWHDGLQQHLQEMIVGRTSCENHVSDVPGEFLIRDGALITEDSALRLASNGISKIKVRSPITCRAKRGVCSRCNGIDHSTGELPLVRTAIGTIAAISICDQLPGVELRVFRMGGPDYWNYFRCRTSGRVQFESLRTAVNSKGSQIALCLGQLRILDDQSKPLETIWIPCGANVHVRDGERVIESQKIAECDTRARPLLAETAGTATLLNFKEGINYETIVLANGENCKRIIPSARPARPAIMVLDQNGRGAELHYLGDGSSTCVSTGTIVRVGDPLAETYLTGEKKRYRWEDFKSLITGGFRKYTAILSDHMGTVEEISSSVRGRHICIRCDTGHVMTTTIPHTEQVCVQKGDRINIGDRLTARETINPNDILRQRGATVAADFMVNEFQHFCRSNRISIADQHFELLVRHMLSHVEVEAPGDSDFVTGETVLRTDLENVNEKLEGALRVLDCGASAYIAGQLVSREDFRTCESQLKQRGLQSPTASPAIPATSRSLLLGFDALPLRERQPLRGFASPSSIAHSSLTGRTQELERVVDQILLGLKKLWES